MLFTVNESYFLLQSQNLLKSQSISFSVSLSVSFFLFPCSKGKWLEFTQILFKWPYYVLLYRVFFCSSHIVRRVYSYSVAPQLVTAFHFMPTKVKQYLSKQALTAYPLLHEMETRKKNRHRQRQRQRKKILTINLGGFVIVVRYITFIESKQHSLEPTQ